MSRRGQSIPPEFIEKPPRSRCLKIICVSWKVLTCIISHVALVSLVVGYCVGGAYLFQHLELENEMNVKKSIQTMRNNVTNYLWIMTEKTDVLREDDWTTKVEERLGDFENDILLAMKRDGWDGDENLTSVQWTFEGSLFYSIIVITTIGYGHIAPRTQYGKVTTIFYAILGIPLMLLCLSNIGDVMASSFRFLYWRVCCYVCTREPKRRRGRNISRSRQNFRYASRSQPPPSIALRRSMRASQRSTDSGFPAAYDYPGGGGQTGNLSHAYSDPELRHSNFDPRAGGDFYRDRDHQYNDRRGDFDENYDQRRYPSSSSNNRQRPNPQSRFGNRSRNRDRARERHTVERERNLSRSKQHFGSNEEFEGTSKRGRSMRAVSTGRDINRVYSQTLPSPNSNRISRSNPNPTPKSRAKSVDPRCYEIVDDEVARKTPILCNRYAIDDLARREPSTSRNTRPKKRNSLGGGEPSSAVQSDRQNDGGRRRNHSASPVRTNQKNNPNNDRDLHYQNKYPSSQHPANNNLRYGNQLEIPERQATIGNRNSGAWNIRGGRKRYSGTEYNQSSRNSNRSPRYDDDPYYDDDYDDGFEMQPIRKDRRSRRSVVAAMPPSPRIMSPMGFAIHRQAKIRTYPDDDSYYDDEIDSYGNLSPDNRPVPIWLCVFLVVSYIIAGAFIFRSQEGWSFLDATYFCFITLTTIGFGDFVPSTNNDNNPRTSIALCSLYLLFGISLLAMSFNLVQEEVIANVKEVGRRLGILKEEEPIED